MIDPRDADPRQVDPYENFGIPTPPPSFRRGCLLIAGFLVLGLALGFWAGRVLV